MDDRFSWDIVIDLAVKGAKGSEQELKRVLDLSEQLSKEGKITEKSYDGVQKAFVRAGNSASTTGGKVKELHTNLVSTRYALYDVSTTAFATSAAITALGAATLVASAKMESAFTGVERTLDPAYRGVDDLRQSLVQMSREIPQSFAEISEIAMLGNQLGIAGDDVTAFTETVAQFSAITGISVNETSLAFGQLGNLLGVTADQFSNLGSSIALVGVNSAATESQIISVARELAPSAAAAGFTADQVIGLSGALASLKVPPERSRSTILQFFETLNMAVANGGDDLQNFATAIGVTAAELDSMVRAGQGESIFRRFIDSAATADTVEVTQALDALGLAGLRVNPTIRALSQNTELLNRAFSDAATGFNQNTELARQFAFVTDDLASRWQIFVNAVMEAAAAVGDNFAPAAITVLDIASNLLTSFAEFANSPIGSFMVQLAGTIAGVVAAFSGLIAVMALSGASLFAINFALQQLAATGAGGALIGVANALGLVKYGAEGATTATLSLRGALQLLGRATIVIGLLQVLFEALMNLREAGNFVIDMFVGIARSVVAAARIIADAIGMIPGARIFTEWANGLQTAFDEMGNFTRDAHREWNNFADDMGWVNEQFDQFPDSGQWGEWTDGASDFGSGLGDLADGAGDAAAEVRTLVDYANDLASVWDRAFDIRFSGQSTFDDITLSFIAIQEASAETARNIRSLRAEIQGLQSNLSIQQYFLGIAQQYGDAKRVQAIQANIAKLQADIADKTDNLNDEQAKNSKVLTGNSKAAIDNRKQITSLVDQYETHIGALASSGLSSDELLRRTEALRQEFIRQATQLGYSTEDVLYYARAFDDVRVAIQNIPRNITVDADMDPAYQALEEFLAQASSKTATIGIGGGGNGFNAGKQYAQDFGAGMDSYFQTSRIRLQGGGNISFTMDSTGRVIATEGNIGNLRYFNEGGFTGRGGMMEPAGIVHKGEYVVPKRYVDQRTGLPKSDAMGRLQRGARGNVGYASGGYVSGSRGRMVTDLSAMSIQQLAQAVNRYLVVDGRVVAQTASNQYAQSTARGEY
ncbi:MAG: putative minor tail protein [Prokaryotic dsDNA virus sp.]|nr:MAG: putative minor tail protein [Prokaryotic dsDNA virus sp.]